MSEIGPEESAVLSALSDGVMLIRDGRIGYANPAAARLLGSIPPESVARLAPSLLVGLVERSAVMGQTEEVFERGHPPRWIQAVAGPLADGSGGVVVVLRDVTERRRIEEVRRDFVANASHELKTPVASIQAVAETLVRAIDDDPEAARRFARQLQATAGRLSQMVKDLLDLSRVESEAPEIQKVNVRRLVVKEIDRIADRVAVNGIELKLRLKKAVASGNRKDLRLLVRNLIENAVSYTPAGGTVTVKTFRSGDEAVIRVSDTGIGIPQRDLPRIFERFYRVDDARNRETGGTGLGLAIVRHVAEEHGGTVEVESELGRGSTFRVRLPIGNSSTG